MKYLTTVGAGEFVIEVLDETHILVDGKLHTVDFQAIAGQLVFTLLLDNQSYEAYVYPAEDGWQVLLRGRSYLAQVADERQKRLPSAVAGTVVLAGEFTLRAPMPGLVVSVPVSEGQAIQVGEVLVVLESMKMQNELKAPRAGVVIRLKVKAGDRVEQKQALLALV